MTRSRFIISGLLIAAGSWSSLPAADGEIELLTETLPWAAVDMEYSPPPLEVRVSGRCPAGGVGFAVVSGSLPAGMKLSRLGYFSGAPTQTGLFEINVRATNGCSWSARRFSLLVTNPPKLSVRPEQLTIETHSGENPPASVIHVTSSWPQLPYAVQISYTSVEKDWLEAISAHGMTAKESVPRRLAEIPGDDIGVRLNTTGLKPGIYRAEISITAWQSRALLVPVTLNLKSASVE
jgi:hypothetical protein